jgi:hypothetical protein
MSSKGYARTRAGRVRAALWCAGVLLGMALGACASHERRCVGKLEPINPPPAPSATTNADGQHGQ